jgi:archaellum component FlaF (FlaF/FlaG flagellin family)
VESLRIVRKHFGGGAVNHVIAALLVIAVTVSAAVLLYVFAIGLVTTLSTGGGQQIKQEVILQSYAFPVDGPLTVTVTNMGLTSVDLSKADFFINGQPAAPGPGCSLVLPVGGSCTTTLSLSTGYGSLRSGTAYPVKIVTPDGAIFVYSCIYDASG